MIRVNCAGLVLRSLCALLVGAAACNDASEDNRPKVPNDWLAVEGPCGLTLHAPPGLVTKPVRGIDSCVALFEDASCTYQADLGNYSDSLEPAESGRKAESVRVVGVAGRLVTAREADGRGLYFIGVHLPSVWRGESPALTVTADCATPEAQAIARDVLLLLELAPPSDEPTR